MRFQYKARAFSIRFHYTNLNQRIIECMIYDDTGDALKFYGSAYCHPKDRFVKETGRKIALAQALAGATREFRTLAWHAYHNRFRHQSKGAI